MRILSWNILQGGGKRAQDIAQSIVDAKPDILALQEFRNGKSAAPLLDACRSLGLTHIHRASSEARKNTAMVASRYPMTVSTLHNSLDADLVFCASLEVAVGDSQQLDLFTGHLPQKKKQIPYLDALYKLALADLDHAMIIGDLNCGIPFEDSDTKSFDNTHLFQSLLKKGWTDSWRSRNAGAKEFSWVSSRDNGYRYDHCLCTKALDNRVQNITYLHELRTSGLSDHSAILVELQ